MFNDTKIKDIIWYHKPLIIDTEFESLKEGQEISFDIILENENSNFKNENIKIEMNILVDEIYNNRIVFDVIAVQNYSKICNEYFKFLFVWYFTDHYQIEHMKVINSKLIIPTVEYTDFIVDLIRNNLFLNTPNDYNNLNILDSFNPESKYSIITGYSRLSPRNKITFKKKSEISTKNKLKNLKPKIINNNLVSNTLNYEVNHENITNFTGNIDVFNS